MNELTPTQQFLVDLVEHTKETEYSPEEIQKAEMLTAKFIRSRISKGHRKEFRYDSTSNNLLRPSI